jgi:hypothetical protein
VYDFMGSLQSRLPHPLHQQMDHSKEEHLSALPEGMDNSQDSKRVIQFELALNHHLFE